MQYHMAWSRRNETKQKRFTIVMVDNRRENVGKKCSFFDKEKSLREVVFHSLLSHFFVQKSSATNYRRSR
jgi:hypothetical protein